MKLPFTPGQRLAILCVVLAIPTGWAIWSKLQVAADEDALVKYSETQRSTRRAAQNVARIDANDARAKYLPQLYGGLAGEPGPLFDGVFEGVMHGGFFAESDGARARIDDFEHAIGAHVSIEPHAITVDIPPDPDPNGDDARAAAIHAWQYATDGQWLDPFDRVRASVSVDSLGTHVRWEPYTEPTALVDALPTIGAPSTTAREYTLPPLGWSNDEIAVDVDVDRHDVVTGVHVVTNAPGDHEKDALLAALRARYGDPLSDDGHLVTWKAAGVAITSANFTDGLRIDVVRAR